MKKPRVTTNCIANHYTAKNERIIEFTAGNAGGLISFYIMPDGTTKIELYRLDPATVTVSFDDRDAVARHQNIGKGVIITPGEKLQ